MFFAAVLGFAVLTTPLTVRQLIRSGLAAPIALAASSLALTWQETEAEFTPAVLALRCIPPMLVFGFFNLEGRTHFATLATLWTWIWLEFTFLARFGAQPALLELISGPVVLYFTLPGISALLVPLLASIIRSLREASNWHRGNTR